MLQHTSTEARSFRHLASCSLLREASLLQVLAAGLSGSPDLLTGERGLPSSVCDPAVSTCPAFSSS